MSATVKTTKKESPGMRLIDPAHPFFRPAWRRYLVVAALLIWAGVEWSLGQTIWGFIFAAAGLYLAWHLIWTWRADHKD